MVARPTFPFLYHFTSALHYSSSSLSGCPQNGQLWLVCIASWAQPMYVCRWMALPLASKRWGALPDNNPNSVINELLLRRLRLLHSLSTLLSRTLSYSHLSCEGSPIRGYPYYLNHKKSGNPFPPNYCSNNPRLMYFQLCIYFALAHTQLFTARCRFNNSRSSSQN